MTDIPIQTLRVDPSLQPRCDGLDADHVRALEQARDGWPPVTVVQRDKAYLLVDGFHRFAAAQNLALESITAEIVAVPPDGDLYALAFDLNARHGRPLSLDDRRAEVRRVLTARPPTSNMEVSRRVGLSPSTVASIREALERAEAIQPAEHRIGASGRVYTVAEPPRPLGELPVQGFGELLTSAIGRIFTPAQRVEQRNIAAYFRRLAVALEDLDELDGCESAETAAEACRLVLGEDAALELAKRLGWASRSVLDVAIALGYEDSETES